ncbi:MAG: hypothetical protein HY327_03915 [Chloroflexi bacterium]|nr:hypothetical protein [Chloroflexota bacterium]
MAKSSHRPFLSQPEVARWRDFLGGLDGWSPFITPGPMTLELFSKLDPPLDVNKEQFIFDKEITADALAMIAGPFRVGWVTIKGKEIKRENGWFTSERAFLQATDSRLLAYNPGAHKAAQVLYDEIVSLEIRDDHFVLHLEDGGVADIHMKISRPGLFAVAALIGAPTGIEKGMIADRENARAADAQSFVRLFSRFFAEIVDKNRS